MSKARAMNVWRVIITDSEGPTGVAPVCPNHAGDRDSVLVYDCCPGPHIECWNPTSASHVAAMLTAAEAEVCS